MSKKSKTLYIFFLFVILFGGFAYGSSKTAIDKSKLLVIKGDKQLTLAQYLDALSIEPKHWYAFWEDKTLKIKSKKVVDIKDTLRDFLDSEGFYNGTIKVTSTAKKVTIAVKENKPAKVSKIEIKSDYNISKYITLEKDKRFDAKTFIAIKHNIKAAMMKVGYCNYKLDTKAYVDIAKHSVDLKYNLQKEDLCHFGKTKILEKPKNISKKVILSRLQYHEGDVFSTEKINQTFDTLNSLDAFGSGTVSAKEKDEDAPVSSVVPMEISLSPEDKLNIFKGGVGYDTTVGFRAKLYYERRNFMGDARKFTTTINYSKVSKSAEASLFWPVLFNFGENYLDSFAKIGYKYNTYDAYTEKNSYLKIKLSYKSSRIMTDIGLGLENINIKDSSRTPGIINGTFLLLYPFVNFVYDARDSKIDPKNGYYFSSYVEYGIKYKADASSYLKYLLEGRYIKSFGDLTLAAVAKVGLIDEKSGVVPASKLFYAGGSYSNRAYGEHGIGYITSPILSSKLGGKTWMNFSLEADYPVFDNISAAVFFDSTMLNKDSRDFKGDKINSAGVGVRYLTPVGPIKVDLGINIKDYHQYGISFQMGQSF